jgi:hypothetical protein
MLAAALDDTPSAEQPRPLSHFVEQIIATASGVAGRGAMR